nr:unnamed protein product [Haemonchus contortus]
MAKPIEQRSTVNLGRLFQPVQPSTADKDSVAVIISLDPEKVANERSIALNPVPRDSCMHPAFTRIDDGIQI